MQFSGSPTVLFSRCPMQLALKDANSEQNQKCYNYYRSVLEGVYPRTDPSALGVKQFKHN